MQIITVDAMGEKCPAPVIKTRKALQQINEPCTVQVHVDNSAAEQNILRLASSLKIDARSIKDGHKHYVISMNVRHALQTEANDCACQNNAGATVVAVGSDRMGEGNSELGTVLMKGFFYALSHSEQLPNTILFYNGGANLTTEGSDLLEDLHYLEENGVEILTCGTCMEYYQIKDKLAVGKITNMYQILQKLMQADKIIKP